VSPRLALPLQRATEDVAISQLFGANPEAYARFGLKGHNGLDFAVESGELVVAVDDGQVLEVRFDPAGYGVTVRLEHDWGESRYAHGQRLTVPVEFELGHMVHGGGRIFLAEGGHVHFGVRLRREDGSLDYSNANGFGGYEDPLPCLHERARLPAPAPAAEAPVAKPRRSAAA
jgi:murein DD-endopeptidase MepM/ murein hydrolase activator NlpD